MKLRGKRTVLCIVLCLGTAGCAKVKPGAYQVALDRYYRTLAGGATEEKLNGAAAAITEELKKSPADASLLMLRASARLDLLRMAVETRRAFDADRAKTFLDDLRLLQSVLSKPGARPVWLTARVQTMWGDAIALAAQAPGGPAAETGGAADEVRAAHDTIRSQIVAMQLYRLAVDAYLRAGTLAAQCMESARGGKDAEGQIPAISQEMNNARDGYVSALTGVAQSEGFLRLASDARRHLVEASAANSGGAFPPAGAIAQGPSSFFSAAHDLASKQAAALEALTPDDFMARVELAENVLREEIAARLLGTPVQPVSANALGQVADRIADYLAGVTVQALDVKIAAGDNVAGETISFRLAPHPLYGFAGVRADVPSLTLQAGAEKIPIRFAAVNVGSFTLASAGIAVSIRTGAGLSDVTRDKGGSYYLQRTARLLAREKAVAISGPAGNALVQTVVP